MSCIPHVDSLLGPRLSSKGQFPSPPDTRDRFLWCQPSCPPAADTTCPQKKKPAIRCQIASKEEASLLTAQSQGAWRAAPGSTAPSQSPAPGCPTSRASTVVPRRGAGSKDAPPGNISAKTYLLKAILEAIKKINFSRRKPEAFFPIQTCKRNGTNAHLKAQQVWSSHT